MERCVSFFPVLSFEQLPLSIVLNSQRSPSTLSWTKMKRLQSTLCRTWVCYCLGLGIWVRIKTPLSFLPINQGQCCSNTLHLSTPVSSTSPHKGGVWEPLFSHRPDSEGSSEETSLHLTGLSWDCGKVTTGLWTPIANLISWGTRSDVANFGKPHQTLRDAFGVSACLLMFSFCLFWFLCGVFEEMQIKPPVCRVQKFHIKIQISGFSWYVRGSVNTASRSPTSLGLGSSFWQDLSFPFHHRPHQSLMCPSRLLYSFLQPPWALLYFTWNACSRNPQMPQIERLIQNFPPGFVTGSGYLQQLLAGSLLWNSALSDVLVSWHLSFPGLLCVSFCLCHVPCASLSAALYFFWGRKGHRKRMDFRTRRAWVWIPARPLPNQPSEHQSPHL